MTSQDHATLSKQAEPTDTYTAVEMATAAAQGFRDGQAAVEQATAQDEQEVAAVLGFYEGEREPRLLSWNVLPNGEHRLYARPAQAEQQPVSWQFYQDGKWWNGDDRIKDHRKNTEAAGIPVRDLYAAPIAQTALSAVTAERDAALAENARLIEDRARFPDKPDDIGNMIGAHIGNLKAGKEQAESYARKWAAKADLLRKDAERWRYVSLQGDDTHWLNLLRVDLEDFGGNINAAVDALIDGEAPAMAAKEA